MKRWECIFYYRQSWQLSGFRVGTTLPAEETARRIAGDIEVFKDIEEKVDLVLDGRVPVRESAELILAFAESI